MSYRVYIRIKDENNKTLFSEQIFGNNIDIPDVMKKSLNLNYDECLDETKIMDVDLFLEEFKRHTFENVNKWINDDKDDFIESFQDLKRMMWLVPDWSIYGSFVYLYVTMQKLSYDKKNTFYISAN